MIPSRNPAAPRKIRLPRFFVDRSDEFDWGKFGSVMFSSLAFVVLAIFALSLSYAAAVRITRKPGPPPKVITKVIHESAMTAAQNAYIEQCKQNTSNGSNGVDDYAHGVPDVHGQVWTCTFAKSK